MIKNGANVNTRDKDGNTPFMLAATHISWQGSENNPDRSGYEFSLFQVLIDAGASIRTKELPVVWVTDMEAVTNPEMLKFLKSYKKGKGLKKRWWQLFS